MGTFRWPKLGTLRWPLTIMVPSCPVTPGRRRLSTSFVRGGKGKVLGRDGTVDLDGVDLDLSTLDPYAQ